MECHSVVFLRTSQGIGVQVWVGNNIRKDMGDTARISQ